MSECVRDPLDAVIRHGAPAQRDEALRLAGILDAEPADDDALAAAAALVDAYLHDPHLERG